MERGNGNGSGASRLQRNMKERVRRKHMKELLSELAFLTPLQSSKVSATELLENATNHIKQLQERLEERRRRRALLLKEISGDENKKASGSRIPVLNISCSDSSLEINLICGLEKNFMLHDIISILQQEGAEVISSTQYNTGDRVIYVVKSQAISPRIGVETTRIRQRIKDLCF
ncbi:transcription factor bHLH167-like [Mangifera indica]|uniref:transcription factor bHLH167-like n=1 Tax=Mangifera indica TaxID=29780 RepID=UPI001CF95499|nr:transcription factor bHLH167-like [Mangifera indica]XP_044488710.1 transcription factor bHLH167-like [Mangifera indica]